MNAPVFVIMAAGMGSRFGGLKQITPVDGAGNKLLDFSLYDARRAGFQKVVFIIKRAIEQDFKEAVGRRMERYFDVRYVYQELDRLPEGFSVPEGRVKPWGTAHAVACARDEVDGPFAVLNADDFYGADAIRTIYDFLREPRGAGEHAMVGYQVRNTLTENGGVSRGVCELEDGFLRRVVERHGIERRGDGAAYPGEDGRWVSLPGGTTVSMNLWGFQRELMEEFVERFPRFLEENLPRNPLKCEYYVPYVANLQLEEKRGSIRVLSTDARWHGVTYPQDLQTVKDAIAALEARGDYPPCLWL